MAAIAAIATTSTQSFAMTESGWSASAAYGILMPVDSKSVWADGLTDLDGGADSVNLTNIKQKNANFFDVGVTHAKSGFGMMYSATAKDVKFTMDALTPATDTALEASNSAGFIWKYNGVFATYKHPLGQMLDLTLAVGSVKQTFDNTLSPAPVSKRDLGARVGIGAFYNLSKEAALKLGLSYNYFKEFNQAYANDEPTAAAATLIKSVTPKFNASGLAASVALVYTM